MGKKVVATVSGTSAVGFLAASLAIPPMLTNPPWWLQPLLLAIAAACILVPFVWWALGAKGGSDEGGINQTSHGPNSPNLGGSTFHVPVSFGPSSLKELIGDGVLVLDGQVPLDLDGGDARGHAASPPAATQPRKEPFDPMKGYRRRGGPIVTPLDQATADLMREAENPIPNLPLNEVLVRVYAKLGGAPAKGEAKRDDFLRRVNREIMDKVAHRHMHVWGRFGERPLTLIDPGHWERGTFDHKTKEFRVQVSYGDDAVFTDLHFNRVEVDPVWPKPLRTTNDGRQ